EQSLLALTQSQNSPRQDARFDPLQRDVEADLLFRLARAEVETEESVDFSGVNWPRLLQLATDENALIVLRDHIKRVVRTVPVEVERHVVVLALHREFRLRQLQHRLEESLRALNAAGIDVLLLKGAALAYTVYGSFGVRPMRDIDILVRHGQAEAA